MAGLELRPDPSIVIVGVYVEGRRPAQLDRPRPLRVEGQEPVGAGVPGEGGQDLRPRRTTEERGMTLPARTAMRQSI